MTSSTNKLSQALTEVSTYLNGSGNGGKDTPTLRDNWIYLQLFSTYGVRLPSTAADLCTVLGISSSESGSYTWFQDMVNAYAAVDSASSYFLNTIFQNMVSLGNGLNTYSNDMSGKDGLLSIVNSQITSKNYTVALDLIKSLTMTATNNYNSAKSLANDLATFKTKLIKAQSQGKNVKTAVDNDKKTSEATIKQLEGGSNISGSIAQLTNMLNMDKKEYKKDVTIASTTVTYAWVVIPMPPLPVGLIAASVVAGVYGHRAVEMLNTIDQLKSQIANAQAELKTALAVHHTSDLADSSLESLLGHVKQAITSTNAVQNAWSNINDGLQSISQQISTVLIPNNIPAAEKEACIEAFKTVFDQMNTGWGKIQPQLDALTKDPYITVNQQDVTELLKDVKKLTKGGSSS